MFQKSPTKWILLLSVIAIVGVTLGVLQGPKTAGAGQNPRAGQARNMLNVWPKPGPADGQLQNRPVMVSILRDAALVHQTEIRVGGLYRESFPFGRYDVRVEGEGMVTAVKRGINVTESGAGVDVHVPMLAGQGVHIVEYATGALSREQIADTLRSLEARIAKLEAK